jgi:predicted amidohydrolase
MHDLRVAAVVMRSPLGQVAENLAKMKSFVSAAASRGARAICFPELNITGYGFKKEVASLAETIPGPSTDTVLAMAREYGILVLAGLIERGAGDQIFLSHFAAAPEGLLGVYRKIHLGPSEEGVYEPGTECPVFQSAGMTFGIELCFDGHFPELSTILALRGAEVIFIPHASPPRESAAEKRQRWLRYLDARAYDNSLYVVACNQIGEMDGGLAFSGAALVLSPRGEVLAADQGDGEQLVLADLNGGRLKRVRENPRGFFLGKRRAEIYRKLGL